MILKTITDFIYGTGRVRRRFEQQFPDEKVLAADASKGIRTEKDQDVKRGANWMVSQRSVVMLTSKRIHAGKWDIPIDSIVGKQLLKVNSLFGPGLILKIETSDQGSFQFGMHMNDEWATQDALPLEIEKGKISNSAFSTVVRLILLGYIIYWLIERFS